MLHPKMAHVYVGVDTHRHTHTAVIINCFFEKLGEITFLNRPSHFKLLIDEVNKHLTTGITPIVGLEDAHSSGRELADFLIKKEIAVKHVNSSLSSSERSNQATLHKTDSHDALCISRTLLSKMDELPTVEIKDNYWAIQQLVTRRAALVKTCNGIKNQLHSIIIHHYPSYKKFFYAMDSTTALAFWEEYPSPLKLKGVSANQLGKFLSIKSKGSIGEERAKEILEAVKSDGVESNEFQDTRDFIVVNAVQQLNYNNTIIKQIEDQMEKILPQFGYKLETMKGIDTVTAACLISEICDINRFSTPAKLSKYAGISPVDYSSGQTDKKLNNRGGNRSLNRIFFCLAVIQVSANRKSDKVLNPFFYEFYHKKISQGKTKKQALKAVMRRLVNIVWGMMKNQTEYKMPDVIPNVKPKWYT